MVPVLAAPVGDGQLQGRALKGGRRERHVAACTISPFTPGPLVCVVYIIWVTRVYILAPAVASRCRAAKPKEPSVV